MIEIRIQCGCGQPYAFDVEPVGGRMPSAVACPVCGADGTVAANAVLAQSAPAQPAAVAAFAGEPTSVGGLPLRVAGLAHSDQPAAVTSPAPARPASRRPTSVPQIDRVQVLHEARAKISWGDPPEEVLKFLRIQGFSKEDASELVQEMFQERAATIRGNGIKKLIIGVVLICVPIASFLSFLSIGFIPIKLFALTVMVGLWGVWMIFKGTFMVLAPKFEPGDVSEQ